MSGSFFPGVLSFNAFDGGTASLDGESLTGTGETIRSPWINAGMLARVRWELASGTFTDVLMRSSAGPAGRNEVSPIHPGTGNVQYLASGEAVPATPDWTAQGTFSAELTDGALRVSTTTFNQAYRSPYVSVATNPLQPGEYIVGIARLAYVSGTGSQGVRLVARCGPSAFGGGTSVFVHLSAEGQIKRDGAVLYQIPGFAAGKVYDLIVILRGGTDGSDGIRPPYAEVWLQEVDGQTATDLSAAQFVGYAPTSASNDFPYATWGNVWDGGTNEYDWHHCLVYGGSEWETVTNNQTEFTALDRGYVQLKGTLDGTLAKLDLANDLTAPDDLTVTASPESSGVIWALASAPDSGNVLFWERTGPSTSASEYASDERAYAWSDCENGEHTVSVRQATPDGVLSVNAATATPTLPATPPSVVVTITPDEVSAGETAEASAVLAGGATATLNGASWDGSSTTVVTGIQGSTPTAPTIGSAPSFVSGALTFNKPAAGMFPLATYRILSSDYPQGPYTVALSKAWGDVTWTSDQVTATALGLAVDGAKWYVDEVVDESNLSDRGETAAYGGDPNSRECVVSFDFGAEMAASEVAYYYSHPMTVRGGSYAKASGRVTLDGDGVGSVSLPRTAAGTCADGDSGRPFVTFIAPGYSSEAMQRTIPDAAAATFAGLREPGA